MEALFWVAGIIIVLLLLGNALPGLLKKTAVVRPVIAEVMTDVPTAINTDDENRRRMFDRMMLLQSLLEEFKVPVEQQRAVVQPLVLRLLPCTNTSKE